SFCALRRPIPQARAANLWSLYLPFHKRMWCPASSQFPAFDSAFHSQRCPPAPVLLQVGQQRCCRECDECSHNEICWEPQLGPVIRKRPISKYPSASLTWSKPYPTRKPAAESIEE